MTLILIICVNVNEVTGCEGQRANNYVRASGALEVAVTVIPNKMMG